MLCFHVSIWFWFCDVRIAVRRICLIKARAILYWELVLFLETGIYLETVKLLKTGVILKAGSLLEAVILLRMVRQKIRVRTSCVCG